MSEVNLESVVRAMLSRRTPMLDAEQHAEALTYELAKARDLGLSGSEALKLLERGATTVEAVEVSRVAAAWVSGLFGRKSDKETQPREAQPRASAQDGRRLAPSFLDRLSAALKDTPPEEDCWKNMHGIPSKTIPHA
jgi:hypothetical protein